ncbi:alkylation response protein AidB-like acyl-CoA dehydrogenase [Actinokineospora baliensis]|uniref:acyl-CoA dehydrogenase family protein n=1 Tax=Actinokineospora baliensis TaxID=547056 RepID=UPI00195D7B3E|nr:acyl-CoA dehydrogenase family protein [Actinokineospora baliensis]MBM7775540.1 alkylation response protein AidB-like acyl-CoA dehydrogenase [Actinokineospora baliensis]
MNRETVRAFVDRVVIPAEAELDTGLDLRGEAKAAGLWALPLPADLGGGGMPLARYLELAEDEGRSDYGPAVLGSASLLTARMLAAHATSELREAVLRPLVSGELVSAYAMTEPGVAGSDPSLLRTTARQRPDGAWIIDGRKWFTSDAARADLVLVVVRTGEELSLFAVPTGSPGFRVERELDVLGAGGQYEISFTGVRVPEGNLVGPVGQGLRLAGERLALGRTLRALRWVGQAQRCLEMLGARAGSRALGDGVLASYQLVQRLAFEAELSVRSARLLAGEAARLVAAGEQAAVEVSLAKTAAARALETAVDAAIQVHGAEGLMAASGLPRMLRVARSARILDGADELHITTTGRRLLRGYH